MYYEFLKLNNIHFNKKRLLEAGAGKEPNPCGLGGSGGGNDKNEQIILIDSYSKCVV